MSTSPPAGRAAGADAGEGGQGGGGGGGDDAAGRRRRLSHPSSSSSASSSRQRSAEAVWPEHFVEAVAVRVAVDAARSAGRLAAAPAVAVLFQVCSTWRNVSRSELLWQQLARRVWRRRRSPQLPSWRDEFVHLHRNGCNFRYRRSVNSQLLPPSAPALACCRLAISDAHLAAGFLDGSVLLFDVPAGGHPLATYGPDPHRDRLGRFSQSISGLALLSDPARLVYSFHDGDIHVAPLDEDPISGASRRPHVGNLVEDGTLIDFAADDRWWVGLFAGVPGRSWRVWDASTEELVYAGGSLTDPDAVLGWRVLTDWDAQGIGRVRMAAPGLMVGCTASSVQVVDVDANMGFVLGEADLRRRGALVETVDASDGRVVAVDMGGVAKVRSVPELEELCRFNVMGRRAEGQQQLIRQQQGREMVGCMNWGFAMVCSGHVIRVWDAVTGEYMYSFRERMGGVAGAMAASDRYVAGWSSGGGLQLWDFGVL